MGIMQIMHTVADALLLRDLLYQLLIMPVPPIHRVVFQQQVVIVCCMAGKGRDDLDNELAHIIVAAVMQHLTIIEYLQGDQKESVLPQIQHVLT